MVDLVLQAAGHALGADHLRGLAVLAHTLGDHPLVATHADSGEVLTVELLVARCAGLDVAKDELVACVRVPDGHGGRGQEVRTFPTFTSGLEALADWLAPKPSPRW